MAPFLKGKGGQMHTNKNMKNKSSWLLGIYYEQKGNKKGKNKPQLTENIKKNTQGVKPGAEVYTIVNHIISEQQIQFASLLWKQSYNLQILTYCLHYFIFFLKAGPLLPIMIIFTTSILSLFFCIRAIKQHYTSSSVTTDI